MINKYTVKKFCKDYTQIENYEEAVNDTTQTWVCHHILGEILSKEQLIDHDFYYDVPPCMLKFMTKSEHRRLHQNGKHLSEETRRKISASEKGKIGWNKGIPHTEEHSRKISEALKGKPSPRKGKILSEETRRKISESKKGEKNPNYSKHLSAETRKKISEARKRYWQNKI